jgi:hypothetical protein
MADGRRRWIKAALAAGFAVVAAGPAFLVWSAFRPEPWDARALRARYESGRFESDGLVFAYRIENHTRRTVQLLPDFTRILVQQAPGHPAIGRPHVLLPIELPPLGVQRLEVKLELPANLPEAAVEASLDDLNGFELRNDSKGIHLMLPRGW